LACVIEVYPSDEFNITYKFKTFPNTIKMGVEGKYLGSTGELKQQSWTPTEYKTETHRNGEVVESETVNVEERQQEEKVAREEAEARGETYDGTTTGDGHDVYTQREEE